MTMLTFLTQSKTRCLHHSFPLTALPISRNSTEFPTSKTMLLLLLRTLSNWSTQR